MLKAGCLLLVVAFDLGVSGQSSTAPPATTFKVGATNVLVDVVVTDRHGAPVQGLTRDHFSILQDGHKQQIVSFEEHAPGTAPAIVPASPLPPGVYSNAPAAPASDSVDILLIDSLNTPVENQVRAHELLVKYLRTLPPDKPVAVFTLSTQLRQLEDFTTDHSALLRAVDQLTANPQKSALLKTQEDRAQELKMEDRALEDALALKPEMQYLGIQRVKALEQVFAETGSFNSNMRVQYTLAAFDQLAGYLAGMPGRKNVLWLSGSFPLAVMPDFELKNPYQSARNSTLEIDRTASLLASARVAIYPIDARGLFPQAKGASLDGGSAVRNPDRIYHEDTQAFAQQAQEQMALEQVANDTGGKAIYNTNDLKGALAEADRDGGHYYALAFVPVGKSSPDKPHSIKVEVFPSGYHLSYRRGYLPLKTEDVNGDQHFATRMQHAVPVSTEIVFRLAPVRAAQEPATAAIAGSNPKAPRPLVRYLVDYQIDSSTFLLKPAADGTLQGVASMVSIVYDREGRALNSNSGILQIHVPAGRYDEFLKQGIRFREPLDVPLQAVSLRAGVFDPVSGRSGSLEVPIAATTGSSSHSRQ